MEVNKFIETRNKKQETRNKKQETWIVGEMGTVPIKKTDIALCLRARDYKGFDNYGSNAVIEFYEDY